MLKTLSCSLGHGAQGLMLRRKASTQLRSMTILSKQSGEEYKKASYTARMNKTGRPVSPHVSIYAFPMTALSSITNRVTGVLLSFGALGLGAIEIAGGSGTAMSVIQDIGGLGPIVATSAKFAVAFPVIFHYCGALRHLTWDARPEMLSNDQVEKASMALFGVSVGLSGIISLL